MVAQYTEIQNKENINKDYIEIGIGLSLVDNLKPSEYFKQTLTTAKTYQELEISIKTYYQNKKLDIQQICEKECDLVSINIAKFLDNNSFRFSPIALKIIHKNIFQDAFVQGLEKYVGVFRDVNIAKNEDILGGDKSVEYVDFNEISDTLEYDFDKEKKKNYLLMSKEEQVLNIAKFISDIWQIHPFREGNTRTIAVFAIKYLQSKGFEANNDIFKNNSKYFRDALVLANYENIKNNIKSDFSYLESFFNKFILNKQVELKKLPYDKNNHLIVDKVSL
ncbi:Fic family protein [Campylobacter sp. RM12640]|uniref:Fic family protein n=1 Tax=unclassified Campylobacter TaxID=2593542 RepID=UPI003015043D|nr:Fic family protein [Campylobacter sp. RM12640]MBZ7989814.1 Fic family protein [Campylobacter sp. RM12635]